MNKICRCGKVIPSVMPRCNECQERYNRDKSVRNKEYDTNKRNKKSEVFYNSSEWITLREIILNKYNHIDLYDYYINKKITYANTVHHIIELSEDWNRRLDPFNMFPLGESNHNKIHGMYKRDKKGTQKILLELLDRWKKEHGQG